ncbi:MAG: HAD family hydrolase [Eubacterium sp.]|nr:HAD family hydrolase [Eubacterium sp.]
MYKAIVFDIGGTLMEYRNMPHSWSEFYRPAFRYARKTLSLDITDDEIDKSVEALKSYNPRINYRENEIPPQVIFSDALKGWRCEYSLDEVIKEFFASMGLDAYNYPETIPVLDKLKADGYTIATLTDVASGMPDGLHKSYFPELLPYFDMYVSSHSCGYRKPNPKGLEDIAQHFGLDKDEIIFIGDEEKDIRVAERFGCRSVLIDRKHASTNHGQDYTIKDLTQIYEIIGN